MLSSCSKLFLAFRFRVFLLSPLEAKFLSLYHSFINSGKIYIHMLPGLWMLYPLHWSFYSDVVARLSAPQTDPSLLICLPLSLLWMNCCQLQALANTSKTSSGNRLLDQGVWQVWRGGRRLPIWGWWGGAGEVGNVQALGLGPAAGLSQT